MMTTETTESFDPEPSARSEVSEVEAEDEDGDVVMPLREKIVRQESTMRMGTVGLASQATKMDRKRFIEEAETMFLFYPWTRSYRIWWGITAVGAIATIFTETYGIAFGRPGLAPFRNAESCIQFILVLIFLVDIPINFNLSYFDDEGKMVYDRKQIARHYVRFFFWIDVIGVFPFYAISLLIAGQWGQDTSLAEGLSLFRLSKMVRLHRIAQLFGMLQYNPHISFMWLTLIRNTAFALVWTHFNACMFYFIARMENFHEDNTWIGGSLEGLNTAQAYILSLYWSIVTFATVGYGDYSPVSSIEQVWGMIFMMLNLPIMAWMIGSITLLVVKNDERTGAYRDSLQTLKQYSDIHQFEPMFHKKLKTSLQLTFFNKEISDEQILRHFPSAVRRKVLRRLYLPSLLQTSLMKDVREQFVDAFLSACKVEIFGSGEEIVQRGSIASDLYLLVAGSAALMPLDLTRTMDSSNPQDLDERARLGTSIAGSELMTEHGGTTKLKTVKPGDFINEVGFLTETPQTDTVRTTSVCKTLTMPKSVYREIAEEHPGSVSKILKNLLTKVEGMAEKLGTRPSVALPTRIEILRAGSLYDTGIDSSESHFDSRQSTIAAVQTSAALTAIQDLIKMHMNKLKDDHTTRFLFAASRGDTATITLMCENGFDPNSSDYDMRTALMVAAFKGNTETVKKILEYQANPNLTDMHGTTALYEAARNGHESTVDVLLEHGAELCMSEGQAASTLCQIVFDGDILKLRRLMKAKIQVNAGDYDGRTAAHIAAAEGNVAALKALVEFGADLELKDRWNNSIRDEAKRANAGHVLEFLKTL